jgi:hypothetical protein
MCKRLVFGFSGDERLICHVTGPRRFPPPNHATSFEIIGEKSGEEYTSKSSTLKTKIGAEARGSSTEVLGPGG